MSASTFDKLFPAQYALVSVYQLAFDQIIVVNQLNSRFIKQNTEFYLKLKQVLQNLLNRNANFNLLLSNRRVGRLLLTKLKMAGQLYS